MKCEVIEKKLYWMRATGDVKRDFVLMNECVAWPETGGEGRGPRAPVPPSMKYIIVQIQPLTVPYITQT